MTRYMFSIQRNIDISTWITKNIIMIHLQTITENKEWAISTSNDVYLRKYQIFRMVISYIESLI